MANVVTNTQRAGWAAKALAAYLCSHECDDDPETVVQDLICDLLHLVRQQCGTSDNGLVALAMRAAHVNQIEKSEDPEV